jgi:seryl-tRNA synthetase
MSIVEKLTELQEEIESLKTRTTELETELNLVEQQLKEEGIKDPNKAPDKINQITKSLTKLNETIDKLVDDIKEELDG